MNKKKCPRGFKNLHCWIKVGVTSHDNINIKDCVVYECTQCRQFCYKEIDKYLGTWEEC